MLPLTAAMTPATRTWWRRWWAPPDPWLDEVGRAYVLRPGGGRGHRGRPDAWSRREMADYKVPREVEFLAELPRNASGKVLKTALRAR